MTQDDEDWIALEVAKQMGVPLDQISAVCAYGRRYLAEIRKAEALEDALAAATRLEQSRIRDALAAEAQKDGLYADNCQCRDEDNAPLNKCDECPR